MIRFVGGPLDGITREIHRNTEEMIVGESNEARYVRRVLDSGEEVFLFDPEYQRRRAEELQREVGRAFDARMDELTQDPPRQPQSNSGRRRRR